MVLISMCNAVPKGSKGDQASAVSAASYYLLDKQYEHDLGQDGSHFTGIILFIFRIQKANLYR